MNYTTIEEFGKKISILLMEILGSGYEAVYKEVSKNNNVCLHGIMISKKGSNIAPSIYIDELYEDYIQGRELNEIIDGILEVYINNSRDANMDMTFFTDFETAKDRILYKLINIESNVKLLEEVPYVKWNDLAVVFYYLLEDVRFGRATILIRNSHLAMWKIDNEKLHQIAKANMKRMQPEEIIPIKQVIMDIVFDYKKSRIDAESVEIGQGQEAMMNGEGPVMYVLSSRNKYFGAAVLLYSKSIKALSDRLNRNLIILPSSVHEVILLPDDTVTESDFFKDMVRDVNDTQLEPEEILSYNVYYYNRFTQQISII